MRVEITEALHLTRQEHTRLDLHGFLNVLHGLHGELLHLHGLLGGDVLHPSIAQCREILASPSDLSHACDGTARVAAHKALVLRNLADALQRSPHRQDDPEVAAAVENVVSMLEQLRVRVHELLARLEEPDAWTTHDVATLQDDLDQALHVLETRGRGRYRIVRNAALQREHDYLLHLALASVDGRTLHMPALLKDVLLDLIAHAYAHTPPGGLISAGLSDDGATLRLVVTDTGRGLPEHALEHLVADGRPASDAGDAEAPGDPALIRAYRIARQFQGRMWVRSGPGAGTRVEITIPRATESGCSRKGGYAACAAHAHVEGRS